MSDANCTDDLVLVRPALAAAVLEPVQRCACITGNEGLILDYGVFASGGIFNDLLKLDMFAGRALVETLRYVGVGVFLAFLNRLEKWLEFLLPIVEGLHVNAEEFSHFLVGHAEQR